MQTVKLYLDLVEKTSDVIEQLQIQEVTQGDEIIVLINEGDREIFQLMSLVMLFFALHVFFNPQDEQAKTEIVGQTLFTNYVTKKQIIAQIEQQYQIKVKTKIYKPFEDIFGMWKDTDVTLENIRTPGWRRTK